MFNFSFLGPRIKQSQEVPDLYPLAVPENIFIEKDTVSLYTKILLDVLDRTSGIPENSYHIIADNFSQSETPEGVVTILARAMYRQSRIGLVYTPSTRIVTKMEAGELTKAQKLLKEGRLPRHQVLLDFSNFDTTLLLKIYSIFEYCLLRALNKSLNLSNALQVKINELRSSVSLADSEVALAQAREIVDALERGLGAILDSSDMITTTDINTAPAEKAMEFIDKKKAKALGMPLSYIDGEQTPGIGSTGEADMRAVERGLKQFYLSIIKPVFETLLNIQLSYRSQDTREIDSAMTMLKELDIVSSDLISTHTKRARIASKFQLDLAKEEALIEKELASAPPPIPFEEEIEKEESLD